MFTLKSRPNPLDQLVAYAGSEYVQNQIDKQEKQRKQGQLQKLSKLPANATPMERFQFVENLDLDSAEKGRLHGSLEKIDTTTTERSKIDKKQKADLEAGAADEKSIETITEMFGPEAGKIWRVATTGGRTDLLKHMVDARSRGENVAKLLSSVDTREGQSPEMVDAAAKTAITGKFQYPKVDPFVGYKPNEVPGKRTELRKENLPEYDKSKESADGAKKEERSLKILKNLNEIEGEKGLPEGLGRLAIDPETGEPWTLVSMAGGVNANTQRWIKTLNDFTTKARESFPGRVTNFDLQRFMARLPGLLNTREGRKIIIAQMELTSQIDHLFSNALVDTYRHYGMDKITKEQAHEIAENKISDQKQELEKQLDDLDMQSDKAYDQSNKGGENRLTEQVLDEYLDKANGDPDKAAEMARKDGYTW